MCYIYCKIGIIEKKHPAPILITTTTSQIIYHRGGEPEHTMHVDMEHKP